jgi:hypothetical protein
MVLKIADNRNPLSLASRARASRNKLFSDIVETIAHPVSILDVGGREATWESLKFAGRPDIRVVLLNVEPIVVHHDNITYFEGNACDMGQFADDEFDIVYSNSVIEHVGDFTAMHRMAREIRRVGKRHFVQTPNKYFPVEPHFVFPAFQFLPKPLQLGLVQNFQLGWMDREPDKARAAAIIDSIHLLSLRDMKVLFPTSGIRPEKTLGMTKSFIACSEW